MAPRPGQLQGAMNEPADMERATAAQKAFVILRVCLYLAAWVSLALSVSVWHVWTPKFLTVMNDVQAQLGDSKFKTVCVITDQWASYMTATTVEELEQLYPTSSKYRDECNFYLYSCIAGIVYAFVFFVVTSCILRNNRVKLKYLEILELSMAVLLALSCLVAASLATDGIAKSCKIFTTNSNFCGDDCQRNRKSSSCGDTMAYAAAGNSNTPFASDAAALKDSIKWLYILRNGLWAACIAFVVLATILLIRYRTVHRRAAGRDAREDPNGDILGELGADDDDVLLRP
eukprot:m.391559 g.391559  ORF g.391559 m.391559 type:complete len:288 (-) comp16760_c1_seq6:5585-6448(-)